MKHDEKIIYKPRFEFRKSMHCNSIYGNRVVRRIQLGTNQILIIPLTRRKGFMKIKNANIFGIYSLLSRFSYVPEQSTNRINNLVQ